MIYECGQLSSVLISRSGATGIINVTSDNFVGQIITPNVGSYSFLCTGRLEVTSGSPFYIAIVNASQSVWTDNFLMGLAGLICGALLAFVLSKYAV